MLRMLRAICSGVSSKSIGGRKMKHALIVLVSVVGLFAGLYFGAKALDPGYDKERAEIYHVAYSHPEITSRVGSVRTASFALKKKEGLAVLSRFFPDDWTRDRSQGTKAAKRRQVEVALI